ncbi:MAG: glucose-6-phosphate dehydrogenase assembly protein OpcA [Mycobacterium sp.]
MIVDLPDTTTNELNKRITSLREEGGAITLGRVLSLVVAPDTEDIVEDAIEAAVASSREHPCRVIVVVPGDRLAAEARLDGQLRVGGDAGAGEVVVLRTHGPLAGHSTSVVLPFLLPDTPVVVWWPGAAPEVPAADPLGRLAIRRITDATGSENPLATLRSRLAGYTQGDTDLAWSRITYWRALLASALDQPPYEPITGAVVSGRAEEPALDILAGWLASRIDGTVRREVGDLKVELLQPSQTITLSRPQDGSTATLSRTARPDAQLPLARRETRECLAEDMRRLDADEVYHEALAGLAKVTYPGG